MPINYLDLQPQIKDYCNRSKSIYKNRARKIDQVLDLLHRCADEFSSGALQDISDLSSSHSKSRYACPEKERIDQSYKLIDEGSYILLASDGSQIYSNHHDALPISLINISGLLYQPGSSKAPEIQTISEFIRNEENEIILEIISEDQVNLVRDIAEVEMLAGLHSDCDLPAIAICDGPLELFHEPRASADHQRLFQRYLQILQSIYKSGRILGGYIDKPRANLVIQMLEIIYKSGSGLDTPNITDAEIFSRILEPGSRSAIFRLNSPSTNFYTGPLALQFFYLNVGRKSKPWIVRVEINNWTTDEKTNISLLHQALLDQCRLMGSQPYPYILHRAHEEAVIYLNEKDKLTSRLSYLLQQSGVVFSGESYKSSAKNLSKRKRMK